MQKYYIYNNKEFNEFLTIIQSDTQPNILLSYTTVEYPSTESGYTRCFDSNTNTWSEQIEDNRNKIVYNINDSTITKVISELGPIPLGFTTVKPTDNVSKKFDTTKNEWYLEAGLTQVDYSDIKNKPFIPKKTSDLSNDVGFITGYTEADPIYTADKPNLALKSELPTKLSELTNDEGYIKDYTQTDPIYSSDKPNIALKSQIPTKTSDLTNDSGYITSFNESDPIYEADKPNIALKSQIPTKTSDLTNDSGYITLDDLSAYYEVTSIQFADYTHYKCTVPQTNIQLNLTQIPDTVCVFTTGDTVEYTVSFVDGMNVNKPFAFKPNKTYVIAIDNYLVVWNEVVSGE